MSEDDILRYVIQIDGLPLTAFGDQWAVAVSKMLLDLRKESKIGTSDTPHVSYLDN